MTAVDWNQFVPLLGVSAPLVIILIQLLNVARAEKREEREERKQITDKFLLAWKEFNEANQLMVKEIMTSLHANTDAINQQARQSSSDHAALLVAIEKLVQREMKGTP